MINVLWAVVTDSIWDPVIKACLEYLTILTNEIGLIMGFHVSRPLFHPFPEIGSF
jgi:hypothetical protein